jgi:hypothetical protein
MIFNAAEQGREPRPVRDDAGVWRDFFTGLIVLNPQTPNPTTHAGGTGMK